MPISNPDKRDNRSRYANRRLKTTPVTQSKTMGAYVADEIGPATELDAFTATEITQRIAARYQVEPTEVRRWIRYVLDKNKKALA